MRKLNALCIVLIAVLVVSLTNCAFVTKRPGRPKIKIYYNPAEGKADTLIVDPGAESAESVGRLAILVAQAHIIASGGTVTTRTTTAAAATPSVSNVVTFTFEGVNTTLTRGKTKAQDRINIGGTVYRWGELSTKKLGELGTQLAANDWLNSLREAIYKASGHRRFSYERL